MSHSNTGWIITVVALASAATLALWYFAPQTEQPPDIAAPVIPASDDILPSKPLHPLHTDADGEQHSLVDLPPLNDSDGYFALALADVFGNDIKDLLVKSGLIEKIVTTIDNLPRSHVAERVRPLQRIPGSFQAEHQDGEDVFTIRPQNFARYEALVDLVTNADIDHVVETYRRFYPLLQQAYINLGYPNGYFNDRVVEVIDHLLATPQPDGPVLLTRPHVLYEYADPDLEALSSGQQLLIRMGEQNALRMMKFLREIRSRIA